MYGLPSSFGLIFIIAGLALAMRFNLFKKIIIILILLNTFTLIRSYSIWNKSYGYPHRKINSQLLNLLTADGLEKYIYIPPQSGSLWYVTKDFQNIFRAKEKYNLFTNTPSKFIESITKNNPPPNQIYFMTMNKNYNITDFSEKIRNNYPKEITPQKIDELPRFK
jgi:hypothetical protein